MGNQQPLYKLKLLWLQDPKDHNHFRNKETNEAVKRIFIDATATKQYAAFNKRIEDNNPRACKILFAHNSNTGLNLICAYVQQLQQLNNWNANNVLGILKGMKLLMTYYGYFKITAQMIRQDKFQRVKVWCNKNTTENIPQFPVQNQKQMFSSFLIVVQNKNKRIHKQIQKCGNFDQAIKLMANNRKNSQKDDIGKKDHNANQYKKLFVEPKLKQEDKKRFKSLFKLNNKNMKQSQTIYPKFLQNNKNKIQGLQLVQSKSIYLKSTQNNEDEIVNDNINDRIKSQSNLSRFKKSLFIRQVNEFYQNCEQVYQNNTSIENIKQIQQLQAGLQKLKNNLKKQQRLTQRNTNHQLKYKPEAAQKINQKRSKLSNLLAKVKSIPIMTDLNRQNTKNAIHIKRQMSPPEKLYSPPRQAKPQRNLTSEFIELKSIKKKTFCPHKSFGSQLPLPTNRKSDVHMFFRQRLKQDKIKQKIQAKNQYFAELKMQAQKILD